MWDIRPNQGAGPLRFGLSQVEVAKLLDTAGEAPSVVTNDDGTLSEYRILEKPALNYRNNALSVISFQPDISGIDLDGVNLFTASVEEAMRFLRDKNGGARFYFGTIFFDKISITASGFYDSQSSSYRIYGPDDQDDRVISVFQEGGMGAIESEFREINLP